MTSFTQRSHNILYTRLGRGPRKRERVGPGGGPRMAWGTVKVNEQRMKFVVLASRREKTMRELCEEFEISRPTGYEWLRRYERGGVAGVVEKSRRPQHISNQTEAVIEQRVVEMRRQRPDWGAKKLRVLLQR